MGVIGKKFLVDRHYWIYKIEPFDTLSEICMQFGYSDWKSIYNSSVNAKFRKRFRNPHQIDYVNSPPFYIHIPSLELNDKNVFILNETEEHSYQGTMSPLGYALPYDNDELNAAGDLLKIAIEDYQHCNNTKCENENYDLKGWEFIIDSQGLNFDSLRNQNINLPNFSGEVVHVPGYINVLNDGRSRILIPAFKGMAAPRFLPKAIAPKMPGTNYKINFKTHGTMGGAIFYNKAKASGSGFKRLYFSIDLAGPKHPTVKGLGSASHLPHWNIKGNEMQAWSGIGNDHVVLGSKSGGGYHVWRPGSRSAKLIPVVFRYVKHGAKILVVVALVSDAIDLTTAIVEDVQEDNYEDTIKTAGRIAGGWAGGFAGAWIGIKSGALVGGAITIETGPGALVGAAIGGIAGGFVFGIAGALGAEWVSEEIYDAIADE